MRSGHLGDGLDDRHFGQSVEVATFLLASQLHCIELQAGFVDEKLRDDDRRLPPKCVEAIFVERQTERFQRIDPAFVMHGHRVGQRAVEIKDQSAWFHRFGLLRK